MQINWIEYYKLVAFCEDCEKYNGSAVYVVAARCYASAAYAVVRCLSVWVSHTFVCSVETNKHIFEFFSPSSSHIILVFFHNKRYGNIPTCPPHCQVQHIQLRRIVASC